MKRWFVMIVGYLLILGTTATAQDEMINPMDPERREQMEALRIWKMTEFLNLSTEQSGVFFPRLKEFEDFVHANQDKQRSIMKKIYELTCDENYSVTDRDVKKYTQELADLEREIIAHKQAFVVEIGDVLTAEQQLKFIVFDNRFRNRLMRSIYQPHSHHKGYKPKERKEP